MLSILIITYNREEETLLLLQNIQQQEDLSAHVMEILLLNNASTQPYHLLETYLQANSALPVNYIQSTENLGVAKGRNLLIEKARAPYLLVLDDDVEFADNVAIKKISTLLEQPINIANNVAVITLNIFYQENKLRQVTAFPHKKISTYEQKSWFLTYYFIGAAHLMKRELFTHTGLYPTNFFYGMEEYDLSFRILDAGYTIAYDNSIKVWHKESPKGRVSSNTKLSYQWINKSIVSFKYLPAIYFYTTACCWSLFYLFQSKGDITGFIKGWKKVFRIPKQTKRRKLKAATMAYLKKVEARLYY